MILLFGALADAEMAYVCLRLLHKDIDFLLVDTARFPNRVDLNYSIEKTVMNGTICYGSQYVDLTDVRSIYVRDIGSYEWFSHFNQNGEQIHPAYYESSNSLVSLAETLPVLVANRPTASSTNFSKPYQQMFIEKHGFNVPRTLVTTIPEEACNFYHECQGQVIYKSVSYQRSIVQRMQLAELERIELVRYCPVQFQEYVPGVDIRVHTVGERLFATEIISDVTDYRYVDDSSQRMMRPVNLPTDVEENCLRLAHELGLVFSGIDLRKTPEGEYYCFEVNTSPGFTFYQAKTGQPIGDAFVELLCQGLC